MQKRQVIRVFRGENGISGRVRREFSGGFALISALTMMMLIVIIAVGLLGLSATTLRTSKASMAQAEAQGNARLALMIALGELQAQLGPDSRISTTADQRMASGGDGSTSSAAAGNRHWTGVFDAWPATADARPAPDFRAWLVSGNPQLTRNPAGADAPLTGDATMRLVGPGTAGSDAADHVIVPTTAVAPGNPNGPRIAWWVADQGVKAAIDTPEPTNGTSPGLVRHGLQAASRNALALVGSGADRPFAELAMDDLRVDKTHSWRQVDFLATAGGGTGPYFHDLAAHSSGLLTNVRAGGFRKDLSMKLEQDLSDADLTRAENVLYSVNGEPGINFQELWAFYQLHTQLQRGSALRYTTGGASNPATTPFLRVASGPASIAADPWHFFKQPVVISYQLVLSFSMRPAPANTGLAPGTQLLHVDFDPIITLWNPLDVAVEIPMDSWLHIGYWIVPYDLNVTISGGRPRRASLTRSINTQANRASVDYHFLGLNAGKVERLVFKPGEVIKVSQTAGTASGPARFTGLDGRKGFNYGGGTAVPLRDENDQFIVLSARDRITYSATPNHLTAGRDASGGNIIDGLGSQNSRRWALTMNQMFIGTPYGQHVGIGMAGLDFCFGYRRPRGRDDRNKQTNPRFNKTAANSTRLYAADFPDVFPPVEGARNTRVIQAVAMANRKEPFMMFSYDAKTETDSRRRTRYLSRFNPRAFHLDFYNLSDLERDVMPYEVNVTPITAWQNAPLDQSFDGNGFFGASLRSATGTSFLTTHSVPREPVVSLAAFQHSFANGFNFLRPALNVDTINNREPMQPQIAHAIGNSLAPPMLDPERTDGTMPDAPHPLADHSYLANRALWDDWFLSGITPQASPAFASRRTQPAMFNDVFKNGEPLPVTRYRPVIRGDAADALATGFFRGAQPTEAAVRNLASHLRVDGMFNVNSTSVEAWKTLLGGLRDRPLVVRDATGSESIIAADAEEIPVANLAVPFDSVSSDESSLLGNQWVGRRTLNELEIDELAGAIVREVRLRGPFLSLADFVNRRVGPDRSLARAGTIQSALDSPDVSINRNQNTARAVIRGVANRFPFPEAEQGAIHFGSPSLVKQGDILTPIAPVLSVRSDSFLVRTYGEARDRAGKVIARAWCEAVVERDRDYIDPADPAEALPTGLTSDANREFGRKFQITSFRWLNKDEI